MAEASDDKPVQRVIGFAAPNEPEGDEDYEECEEY